MDRKSQQTLDEDEYTPLDPEVSKLDEMNTHLGDWARDMLTMFSDKGNIKELPVEERDEAFDTVAGVSATRTYMYDNTFCAFFSAMQEESHVCEY